jgi:hypothetical protein
MPDREKSEIKITDRRLFNAEGELRPDVAESIAEEERPAEPEVARPAPPPPSPAESANVLAEPKPSVLSGAPLNEAEQAEPPTVAEEQASKDAFRDAGVKLDDALHQALGDQHRPEAMEATFESFVASLYMSTMVQLGLLREKDEQPQVDIVGARHTIDTLSMIEQKTRGNLTDVEKSILQDCLFRLRMAFVEMTNLLTRPPAPGAPPPGRK